MQEVREKRLRYYLNVMFHFFVCIDLWWALTAISEQARRFLRLFRRVAMSVLLTFVLLAYSRTRF